MLAWKEEKGCCYGHNEEWSWERVYLRVLSVGRRVFVCHDEERLWKSGSLRVLSMEKRVFTCHEEERVWGDVSLRVMMRRGYGEMCLYVS